MTQTLSPGTPSAATNWTNPGNVTSDNGVYAVCDNGGSGTSGILKIPLSNGAVDPKTGASHIYKINYYTDPPDSATQVGTISIKVELRESGTLRATLNAGRKDAEGDSSYTLSTAEADAISNYDNLEIWVTVTTVQGSAGYRVCYLDYAVMTIPSLALPGTITGVAATDGTRTGDVRVTWNSDSLADTYKIYRHTSNNFGAATLVASGVSGTAYNDTSATAGVLYYWWVKGHNTTGDSSSASTVTTGYRLAAPSAPTAVAATDGLYTNKITVTANDSSGAYDTAASFKLYRNTTNNSGTATLIASGLATPSYDDTAPAAGVTEYYWWKATNAAGDSGFSSSDTGFVASGNSGAASVAFAASAIGYLIAAGTTWTGSGAASVAFSAEAIGGSQAGGIYGRLDFYASDYVWDHRPASIKIAALNKETGALVAGPRTVLTAETLSVLHDADTRMSVNLGSVTERLDRRLQSILLKGTGGNEGGAEVAGRPAPLCFGSPPNIHGIRLSTVDQRWLLHRSVDPARPTCTAVWIGQNPLDSTYWTSYTDADGSLIVEVNGTDILDGTDVTFDVADGIGWNTVASFAYTALETLNPELNAYIDWESADQLDQVLAFTAYAYIDSEISIAEFLNQITGAFAWWGVRPDNGNIALGLTLPADYGVPDGELDESEIIDVNLEPFVPPSKAVVVGYNVNPSPTEETAIVGAAKGTDRAEWAKSPYKRLASTNQQASAIYLSARTPQDYVTPFKYAADAAIVHRWLSATYGRPIRFFRIKAMLSAIRFKLGQVVTISYPRWNMDTAADYRIAQMTLNPDWTMDIIAWKNTTRYVLQGNSAGTYLVSPSGAPIGV